MEIKSEKRPWGGFRRFTHNENTTVKIITVSANENTSLQYHEMRDEFWRVLAGKVLITIGALTREASPGEEFFIPAKTNHRLGALNEEAEVLEISFGDFDETDIVRLEDKYGRT